LSLKDKRETAQKEYGLLGKFWKFPEGSTRVRILAEPVYYTFVGDDGKRKPQWISYFLVRGASRQEDRIEPAYVPAGIIDWIIDTLEEDEDLGFKEYPMPYDIKVTATGSGLQRRYEKNALPIKSETALTQVQLVEFADMPKITSVADERESRVEKKKVVDQETLPAEVVAAHNEKQASRNKAEMNPMFAAFETKIGKAEDAATLDKVAAQIQSFVEDKTLGDFEADMLRDILKNKKAAIAGVDAGDINVEDIPF
jgi:hypothetical protein